MSVAVIPLSKTFGWTASDRGLVSSAFFWGYALTQIPAGYVASTLGGSVVLALAVAVWSVGTFLAPVAAAGGILPLSLTRLVVGLGEGFGPPAVTALLAKHVPASMRARAVTVVFGGMELGNVIGLLTCGPLIASAGWQSIFYLFAIAGFVWVAAWPFLSPKENNNGGGGASSQPKAGAQRVPYGEFLRSGPVWAVICAHFCHNWGYYTMLAWLPSYFEMLFGAGATQAGQTALIPNLAMVAMVPIVGTVADSLRRRGMSTTRVRKLAQGAAFALPCLCMLACAALTPSGGLVSAPGSAIVAVLSLAFAMSTWSRAGLYCNHQDLSPKYAASLLGITNTAGALPGILGVWLTGRLLDATGNWSLALFLPIAAAQVLGLVVYSALASGEQIWE
mmetsp:Transcript_20295/g.57144  ORF Transcript_20295/g.57144 Transcript_20295/m.57144 type:complete len:392 (-) Transcript_20295:184-1359(-)